MTIDEGYIFSNKYRRAVFEELASGEKNIYRIAKKHRIIKTVALRVVDDFVKCGILEKHGDLYVFTKEGEKLVDNIGK